MFTSPYPLALTVAERARGILAIAAGEPYPVLGARLEVSPTTLTRWRKRFERQRLAGLHDAPRSGRGDRVAPALEVGTGHVEGRTVPRHTSAAFVAFLDQVLATQPKRREIHIICDNLSAHKTLAVRAWCAAHPRVTIHYTPSSKRRQTISAARCRWPITTCRDATRETRRP